MGGAVMIQFEKGEIAKLKTLIGNGDTLCDGPKFEDWPPPNIWFEWRGPNVLHLGYSHGDTGDHWAQAIAHEICKRFKIKKGGWEAVGYCENVEEFIKARAFGASIKVLGLPGALGTAAKILAGLLGLKRQCQRAQKVYEERVETSFQLMAAYVGE